MQSERVYPMRSITYRLSALLLAVIMLWGCSKAPEAQVNVADISASTAAVSDSSSITTTVTEISKYGNLILDLTGADLFNLGLEYGDLLELTVADQTLEVPLCSNYTDVDTGLTVLRASAPEETVELAINMGDWASTAGIAEKTAIEEEPGYRWDYLVQMPVQVEITMKQKSGYLEQWYIHQLIRTNAREDYPHLSDEAFANFRVIATTGLGENTLYRASSPINPELGRSIYVDAAARKTGIVTCINLTDASNTYEIPEDSYYESCQVVYLNLGMDFLSEDSVTSLAQGMRFLIDNDAPYLIHCNEGKDRTGFVCALLECLMGATIDEVVDDYMESYVNFYGVEKGTEKYDAVVSGNIIETLTINFDVSDVYHADLAAEAKAYLTEVLELSPEEVTALKAKLSGS